MKIELSTRIRKSLGWRCKSCQLEGILTSRTECKMPSTDTRGHFHQIFLRTQMVAEILTHRRARGKRSRSARQVRAKLASDAVDVALKTTVATLDRRMHVLSQVVASTSTSTHKLTHQPIKHQRERPLKVRRSRTRTLDSIQPISVSQPTASPFSQCHSIKSYGPE